MRKFLRPLLPSLETIQANRWLKPLGRWLYQPKLWHLHRRSVAGGVAVGLFCGLIPGPLQMLGAALLAVWWRVNLPVALLTTLYTNPFTIVPLYLLAYEIGASVSGSRHALATVRLDFPELHWQGWAGELWQWLAQLGKPLLIGLPLLAVMLAVLGYVAVRLLWRIAVVLRWQARKKLR